MALSKPGVFPERMLGKSRRVIRLTISKSGSTRTPQKPTEHDSNLIDVRTLSTLQRLFESPHGKRKTPSKAKCYAKDIRVLLLHRR